MVGISIFMSFPDWERKLKRATREVNLFIAAMMQTDRGMLFDKEGAYNGHQKWAPLVFRSGMILSDTGTLRKSIAPHDPKGRPGPGGIVKFNGDWITIGTEVAYAKLMNDGTTFLPGGVLRPVKAKALKIPIPYGKNATDAAQSIFTHGNSKEDKFIFRKSVKIPPRPFNGWISGDADELSEALRNKLVEVLNR